MVVLAVLGVCLVTTRALDAGGVAGPTSIVGSALRMGGAALVLWCYRDLLAQHWRGFRKPPQASWLLVVCAAAVATSVTGAVRALVVSRVPPAISAAADDGEQGIALIALAGISRVVITLATAVVFSHTLLLKIPVWGRPSLPVLIVAGNAWAFGAVHAVLLGDPLWSMPAAVSGLLANLLYLCVRNVCHVALTQASSTAALVTVFPPSL